jgi:23S rRNA pseudouridine2605 synthase
MADWRFKMTKANAEFSPNDFKVRLQKYISDCGITSRRKAERMILDGRVEVNGQVITELGTKVDPYGDSIVVDGHVADLNSVKKTYLILHKPRGVMTTLSDPEGRETVMDYVKEFSERIYPVGRLDYLSEGLLIMTNDGEVANMIMHPKFDVTKVYEVKIFGSVTDGIVRKLAAGAYLEDGFVKPQSVRVVKQLPTKTWLEFRLNEGRNREIRKLCEAVGLTVDKLKRVAIGGLTVEGVAPGKHRVMSKHQLLMTIGLNDDGSKINSKASKFVSPKKSIDVSRKGAQLGTLADDETFHKFRRESYYESLKQIEESKAEMAKKIAALEDQIRSEEDALKMTKRFRKDEINAKNARS